MGRNWKERLLFLCFSSAIFFLAYFVDRTSFSQVMLGFSVAFSIYFHWIQEKKDLGLNSILIYSILLRVLILFSIPHLSDDYLRFIWDGLLQTEGQNPFKMLPSEVQREDWAIIFEGMNSKEYYSVYPPMMQWIFYTVTSVAGTNVLLNVVLMRIFLIIGDMLIICIGWRLLSKLGKNPNAIGIYALNPLLIIECTGNLHFEGLMMAFTLMGICFLIKGIDAERLKNNFLAVLFLSLGIVTKLTSLLTIPALFRRIGILKTLKIGLFSMFFIMFFFSSFFDKELVHNILNSLNLYFRNFQFNSSIYNIVDYFTEDFIQHYRAEMIGPWIALLGVIAMGSIMLFRKAEDWSEYMESLLFVFSTYLLFASTVHPWYIVNLMAIGIFTRYRYPFLWSFTAVFSYHFYDLGIESPIILMAEYLPVLIYAIWEIRNKPELETAKN